jgi:hypothetical protein
VLQAYAVRDGRRAGSIARTWAWVSADGTTWERHAERGQVTCYRYDHVGQPNFGNATQSFFNSLPTEPRALTRYMRSHVSGSRSTDEAVFVAVGDALRERDGLASPALRAAFVAVLRRTPHVTVRTGEHDALGRPATQASFDEGGGVVTSLYFEPSTGELLEEGVSSGAHGPGNVDVATHESVVDQLPAAIARCPSGGN